MGVVQLCMCSLAVKGLLHIFHAHSAQEHQAFSRLDMVFVILDMVVVILYLC